MTVFLAAAIVACLLSGLVLFDRTLQNRMLPWTIVAASVIFRETFRPVPQIQAAGITILVEDVVVGLTVLVVVGWLLRGVSLQVPQLLIIFALMVVALSILRGAAEFGLAASLNEARETLYFFAGTLIGSFAAVTARWRRGILDGWVAVAGALSALALIRWIIVLGGLPGRGFWYSDAYGGLRTVFASGALVIAIGFLMLLPGILTGEAGRRDRLAGGVFVVTVAVLQHRSVWAVTLVGAALTVLWLRHRLDRRLVLVVGTLCVILAGFASASLDTTELISRASESEVADDNTWQWRVSGWQDLIDTAVRRGDLMDYALGQPYGSGWERTVSAGYEVDVPPHNFYLEFLLRMGVVGFGLISVAFVKTVRRLRRRLEHEGSDALSAGTLLVILTISAAYGVPYNLQMENGLLLGLAIAVWAEPLRAKGEGIVVIRPAGYYAPTPLSLQDLGVAAPLVLEDEETAGAGAAD